MKHYLHFCCLPCNKVKIFFSFFMRWPNHLSLFCFSFSMILFFIWRALKMCSLLSFYLHVTTTMALRQRISNTSSLRVSVDLRVHVSDAYVVVDTIRALFKRIFGALLIDFFFIMTLPKSQMTICWSHWEIILHFAWFIFINHVMEFESIISFSWNILRKYWIGWVIAGICVQGRSSLRTTQLTVHQWLRRNQRSTAINFQFLNCT